MPTMEFTMSMQGLNSAGQLGDGTTTSRLLPVQVGGNSTWSAVAVGQNHTCALRSDSRLFCWVRMKKCGVRVLPLCWIDEHLTYQGHSASQGYNAYGQVGDGTTTDRLAPTLLHFDGWWSAASTGDHHSCGIRSDGSLWCWVSAWQWRWWWTCGLQP